MSKAKLLDSRKVYSGEKISIRKDEFILENKKIQKEVVEHSPSVGLIPIIDHSNILLITQYRHPAKKTLLEIPAGKIEDGETKEEAARRELYEETGYTGKLSFLTKWYLVPSYDTELMYIFIVTNLKKISNKQGSDDDENIKVKKLGLKTALKKCINGQIIDCKTIAALLAYQESIK
ncbi:MAG TPA: NUDIX hydrolase [Nitrososphaeraceae archaeon]|jgi:ADP-ribose pyrophosphatase|nr:NUDIX hydrolase [Nitrososphaeraceae archaeon]